MRALDLRGLRETEVLMSRLGARRLGLSMVFSVLIVGCGSESPPPPPPPPPSVVPAAPTPVVAAPVPPTPALAEPAAPSVDPAPTTATPEPTAESDRPPRVMRPDVQGPPPDAEEREAETRRMLEETGL